MNRIAVTILTTVICGCSLLAQNKRQPAVYQRWINEDVTWIITPAERASYMQLSSDDDRNRFIVDFWERRDPTPDTAENEFKEEHYRRIAYANEHFSDSGPGWKTDRGHIYIVYGPPERMQRLPRPMTVSDNPQPATELWRYSDGREYIFVDACACNEYRLEVPSIE
jgi:GWxTD domain-containing protein